MPHKGEAGLMKRSSLYIYVRVCMYLNLVSAFIKPVTMQILESSQTLLHVLKRETVNLTKKKQSSS